MRHQDGTMADSEEMTLTHATRPEFIASIMVQGVKTSTRSHKSEGLWCRNEDALET